MNTINSRVNRVTKLAPNKVTKKHVPRLVSLSAQTTILQKSKFYVGDFVRIVKKDKAFRKGYKNPLLTRYLRLQIFRRCHRQPTLLLTQTKKKRRVNSINQNCNWFVNAASKMARNQFEDEFAVHVLSFASMQIFKSNTLASFRKFFSGGIQLSGDWRVALSEIIFATNI